MVPPLEVSPSLVASLVGLPSLPHLMFPLSITLPLPQAVNLARQAADLVDRKPLEEPRLDHHLLSQVPLKDLHPNQEDQAVHQGRLPLSGLQQTAAQEPPAQSAHHSP